MEAVIIAEDGRSLPDTNRSSEGSPCDRFDLNRCGSCKEKPVKLGRKAKLLPCLHTFCEECLIEISSNFVGSSSRSSSTDSDVTSRRVRCPVCSQEFLIPGSATTVFLDNLFVSHEKRDVKDSPTESICTNCDDNASASSYCTECSEWLCDRCVEAHKRVKVTKDHTVVSKADAEERCLVRPSFANSTLTCPIHASEQLRLYCENCGQLTCRDCQLVEHRDHQYHFLQDAAAKQREVIRKLVAQLKHNTQMLTDTIVGVDLAKQHVENKEMSLVDEVKSTSASLIAKIKERENKFISELRSMVTQKTALLDKQKKDLLQMQSILDHNCCFAETALSCPSDASLLYTRKVLTARLMNLNSLHYRQKPLVVDDLRHHFDVQKFFKLSETTNSTVDRVNGSSGRTNGYAHSHTSTASSQNPVGSNNVAMPTSSNTHIAPRHNIEGMSPSTFLLQQSPSTNPKLIRPVQVQGAMVYPLSSSRPIMSSSNVIGTVVSYDKNSCLPSAPGMGSPGIHSGHVPVLEQLAHTFPNSPLSQIVGKYLCQGDLVVRQQAKAYPIHDSFSGQVQQAYTNTHMSRPPATTAAAIKDPAQPSKKLKTETFSPGHS